MKKRRDFGVCSVVIIFIGIVLTIGFKRLKHVRNNFLFIDTSTYHTRMFTFRKLKKIWQNRDFVLIHLEPYS